ncbi:alpha beta hydrolase [Bifidobacterium margollesii]|uniref:Alpha beta hydrolase n=1 Tax=Bifidobacterium margollesii TaxID=2020964 RepID=A0A2N5JBF9_9BIFI|nr:HAD family phosphatase [Bifidobacterium margollesii]PLS31521.1 alpha beta hydrolase [Bifidobacterium margollesii]
MGIETTNEGTPKSGNTPIESSDITTPTDVIFDLCGVLVGWQPRRALEGPFTSEEIDDFLAPDDHCGFMYFDDLHDGGMDYAALIDSYEREYGARLGLRMRAYAANVDKTLTGAIPGMPELLADLKAVGIGVWGLTNWGHDTWPVMQHRMGAILGMLDGIVVSGIEGVKKPETAIFDLTVERFGLNRSRTVFVDDSPYNVEAAEQAGLRAIRFESARQTRSRLGIARPNDKQESI